MGNPRNSFPPLPPGKAARQLNRASRNAPQIKYINAMNQPIWGRSANTSCSTTRWTKKAGATPKEIRSASESNSRPNALSTPPMRARRPSSRSKMHASRINTIESLICA
jgi:hypothetical protein